MFDKRHALICAIIFYVLGAGSLVPVIMFPDALTPFTALAPMCLVTAVIMTVVFVRARKKETGGTAKKIFSKQKTAAKREIYEANFNEVMTDSGLYDRIIAYAQDHEIDGIGDCYLWAFYVLDEIYDAMGETGFDEFFINRSYFGMYDKNSYLIRACHMFGNEKLLKICEEAVALEEKYGISQNDDLPEQCVSALEKLNKRFYALDKKVDLQFGIKKFIVDKSSEWFYPIRFKWTPAEIFGNPKLSDSEKLEEWSINCEIEKIEKNSLLAGAYLVIAFYACISDNDVGGFFCYDEEWNWTQNQIRALMKKSLPEEIYGFFLEAEKTFDEDDYVGDRLDYDLFKEKIEMEVMPGLCAKLTDYYKNDK